MTRVLLFDLDGTLVDTEHQHFRAFEILFQGLGVPFSQQIYETRIVGGASREIAAEFLPHLSEDERLRRMAEKEDIYRDMLAELSPLPGVVRFLDQAERQGLRRAVVTNAPVANARKVLRAAGLLDRFEAIVSADELADAKPHPLPYLKALQLLDGTAVSSLAFEDSRTGIRSAVAAGLTVVGIRALLSEDEILALGAVMAVQDYDDPRIGALLA